MRAVTDIRATLTRQVGPLPLYAWGLLAGGGILIARKLTGGSATGGVGGGGTVLGTVTDADPGIGGGGSSGGGNGATQPPVGNGSTGTVGNTGKVTLVTLTKETPIYLPNSLSSIWRKLPALLNGKPRSYRVAPVTLGGKNYWRILTTSTGAPSTYTGALIRRGGTTYTVSSTNAA